MKTTIIILVISNVLFLTAITVGATALYEKATKQPKEWYVYSPDTVLIDLSREKGIPEKWYQYQVEISDDSIYVYDAQELITVLDSRQCGKLDSILRAENH